MQLLKKGPTTETSSNKKCEKSATCNRVKKFIMSLTLCNNNVYRWQYWQNDRTSLHFMLLPSAWKNFKLIFTYGFSIDYTKFPITEKGCKNTQTTTISWCFLSFYGLVYRCVCFFFWPQKIKKFHSFQKSMANHVFDHISIYDEIRSCELLFHDIRKTCI